mgnify:CR=1 FL=1|jgi:predicted DNA-binding protein (UPF0251 family)|tara:strand:- start:4430 stop:5215 length:786 start_codon:yes stop_codon:yes gene_type:complete
MFDISYDAEDPGMPEGYPMSPSPDLIRQTRLRAGLSVAQAAKKAGKAPRTWINYENGSLNISDATWQGFLVEVEDLAQSGELIAPDSEWIPVSEAGAMLGRSRMYVARLVEQGKLRSVKKHARLTLYSKSDIRSVQKELAEEDAKVVEATMEGYRRNEAAEQLGGLSRLTKLEQSGLLSKVPALKEVVYPQDVVDALAERIKYEKSLLSTTDAAAKLGITRQGLELMMASDRTDVVPIKTLFSGKRFTTDMVKQLKKDRSK